tara:strand:+ start:204 stop:413 length:210 start_codon:yes stop_codon:yes gene_type:complete
MEDKSKKEAIVEAIIEFKEASISDKIKMVFIYILLGIIYVVIWAVSGLILLIVFAFMFGVVLPFRIFPI